MRAPAAHTPWPARGVPDVLLGEVVWVGRAMGKTRGGPANTAPVDVEVLASSSSAG